MSTQKGNNSRSRPQKYQNRNVFKNDLYDKSHKTKSINNTNINQVCERCKEIIEWKIKYKKYKPLTQPKKCVKCEQKTVKKAYHVICNNCGKKLGVCTKCCQAKEVIVDAPDKEEEIKLDKELQELLQTLSERKRRTFMRYLNKKKEDGEDKEDKDLRKKLDELKVCDKNSDFGFSDFDSGTDDDEDSLK